MAQPQRTFAERSVTKKRLPRAVTSEGNDAVKALAGMAANLKAAVENHDAEALAEYCVKYEGELERLAGVLHVIGRQVS